MSVRAKFKVQRIESSIGSKVVGRNEQGRDVYEACELRTIVLAPVYGISDPNHVKTKFWQASPSGEIKLGTVNAEAAAQFVLGGEYYVDFTKAE